MKSRMLVIGENHLDLALMNTRNGVNHGRFTSVKPNVALLIGVDDLTICGYSAKLKDIRFEEMEERALDYLKKVGGMDEEEMEKASEFWAYGVINEFGELDCRPDGKIAYPLDILRSRYSEDTIFSLYNLYE